MLLASGFNVILKEVNNFLMVTSTGTMLCYYGDSGVDATTKSVVTHSTRLY